MREVAGEMGVTVDDILNEADVEPDPDATPAPPPGAPTQAGGEGVAAAAHAAAEAAGIRPGGAAGQAPGVPEEHPLRRFKELTEETLEKVGADVGAGAQSGAAFATLVKASLLIALYSFNTDRVFLDQLRYNSAFQWFLDLRPGEAAFDPDAFAADREQALGNKAARRVFDRVVPKAGQQKLFSSPVFQVNGRQIKAWMTQRAGV
ncbi:MAG: transposase [Halofilum sp. (in: g-proteobacteria)]|nr:transposase [Halofilum sp. (in: g-proteobacteria)]